MVDLQENNHNGYIYVIWVREFKTAGEPVYKIGRTSDVSRRVSQYPKGSQLLFCVTTPNMCKTETELLTMLGDHFVKRQDIGNEYFEGDITRMLTLVLDKIRLGNELPTFSGLVKGTGNDQSPLPPKRDPMQSVSEFVQTHREDLSNSTREVLKLYEQYMRWDGVIGMGCKTFTKILKEMYGAEIRPMHFLEGRAQGIRFPELLPKESENCQVHDSNDHELVLQFVDNLWRGQTEDYNIYTATDMLKRFNSFVKEELQIDADAMRHWNAQRFGRRLNKMVNDSRGGLKKQINYGESKQNAYALCKDKMKRYLEKQGVVLTEHSDM